MTTTSDRLVAGHDTPIYVAGHRGLVGSALTRVLQRRGYRKLILRTHAELDLTDRKQTEEFFDTERPEVVFLAAAKVGGIVANNTYPGDFIHQNLLIQTNVVHSAWRSGVKRLLFLGSSCIYPRMAPQPIREQYLLTGPLEPTNRAYALAKIAGIEMCWSYNRQYGCKFLAAMPTNLYGPGDNYHPENSHVIPAMLRKFHEGRIRGDLAVTVWGTGTPRREFLYSDDLADACVHMMELPADEYEGLLGSDESVTGRFEPPMVNIGAGEDVTIRDLAMLVAEVVGYHGDIVFDASRPDGTPRKLLDIELISRTGWRARTSLAAGVRKAYADYCRAEA